MDASYDLEVQLPSDVETCNGQVHLDLNRAIGDLVSAGERDESDGNVRGVVYTLTKVVEALQAAGVELITEHMRSDGGGRGVRLRQTGSPSGRSN